MLVPIIIAVLLLAIVGVAAFLYMRNQSDDGSASPSSSPPALVPAQAPASVTPASGDYVKYENSDVILQSAFVKSKDWPDIQSVDVCKKECDNPNNRCIGFQHDRSNRRCVMYSADVDLTSSINVKIDEAGKDYASIKNSRPNKQPKGMKTIPNVNSEEECKAFCSGSAKSNGCMAYVYSETQNTQSSKGTLGQLTKTCWSVPRQNVAANGSDFYLKKSFS